MAKDQNPAAVLPPVSFDEFAPVSYEAWKEEAVASLKGAPFEKKLLNKTYEGITLEPIYTQESMEKYLARLTFPGAEDFLRGVHAGGYLAQPWAIAQAVDLVKPEDANAAFQQELAAGANALTFSLESNLALYGLSDMQALLKNICLKENGLNVYAGASALPLLGLFKARANANGYDTAAYHGAIGADPIATYALHGELEASLDCYYDQMAAAVRWAREKMPQVRTIYIQGSVYHNAGANAVQELAATMATAIAYMDALLARGLSVDDIAQSVRFGFSIGANFFMEIAKLRAARMIWSQIVKAYGGSGDSLKLNVAARTSAFTETKYDPYVNILRNTTQTFSAVVGGIDAMQVAPFDEACGASDEFSRRVARNIQVMMQHEFNLVSPVDPAGGSWYVETLTGQVAEAAWAEMQQIEAKGGMVACLQDGSWQEEVAQILAERLKKLATRSDRAVGTNMYANITEQPLEKAPVEAKPESPQGTTVGKIDLCVEEVANVFAAGATLHQVALALNQGTCPAITVMAPHRWTEEYEALRQRSEQAKEKVKVFLCNIGPLSQFKARADFTTGFMEVADFQVINNDGFATAQEAAEAACASGAQFAVICSTDDVYPEVVVPLAQAIKAAKPEMQVMLAGAPAPEYKDAYVAAGVDEFIHVRANCLQILSNMQKVGGIC